MEHDAAVERGAAADTVRSQGLPRKSHGNSNAWARDGARTDKLTRPGPAASVSIVGTWLVQFPKNSLLGKPGPTVCTDLQLTILRYGLQRLSQEGRTYVLSEK